MIFRCVIVISTNYSLLREKLIPLRTDNDEFLEQRHGTRNPVLGDVKALIQLEKFLKTDPNFVPKLLQLDKSLQWLKEWRNPFSTENAAKLHSVGLEEMHDIGKRLRLGYLSSLVDMRGYTPHRHKFTSTEVERTLRSAQAFSTGFFYDDSKKDELGEHLNILRRPKSADPILRFFESCASFKKSVKDEHYDSEMNLFSETHVSELFTDFLRKWNLTDSEDGDETKSVNSCPSTSHPYLPMLRTMYRMCAFEATINQTEDRFCRLFDDSHFDAFEYQKDLSFFWSRSYGNPFGTKLAATLLKAVMDDLEQVLLQENGMASGESEALHFMFAHAETLMPLISLFGLYEDDVLWRHDTPKETWMERKFRSSQIMPFAANIGFLLFDCDQEPFIKILHNEKEAVVPGCGSTWCPWEEFKSLFSDILSEDAHAQCHLHQDHQDAATDEDHAL